MPEPREARSIIEDAEQAAGAGDYASAEHLLREALAVQEQTLGPNHADLANTLNNLGIVCEMTDNPIDAEHYFRRAHAIATATLAPNHPFVATSSKNLHDFCAARGRPVETAAVTTGNGSMTGIGRVTCEWVLVSSHTSRASRQQGRGPVPQREFCE